MKEFKTISGEVIKIGDNISVTICKVGLKVTLEGVLTEEFSKLLLSQEVIVPIIYPKEYDLNFFIERLAKRKHWNIDNMHNYLKNVKSISISAFMNIMAKEIALFLNEGYQNHISDSKEIWIISMLNGKVLPIKDKNKIITYKSFAAFRSKEDAYFALKVLSPIIEDLFGSEK